MTPCESMTRVASYHDGQLPPDDARQFERHLALCPVCAAELAELREVSTAFAEFSTRRMSEVSLSRIHDAIDAEPQGTSILRIGGMLAGLAASILVIGSAWLLEKPTILPTRSLVVIVPTDRIEMIAMDQSADAFPGPDWNAPGREMLADARLADWMVENLNGRFTP